MNYNPLSGQLLPPGFRDLLPPEAQAEEDATRTLIDAMAALGYQRVKPPLAEFEDSLFSDGPGALMKENAFRFLDPESRKMMAVRFDITVQIARIATTRLADHQRPLRVMYANDVLRTQSSHQRADRQFRQVGAELIGAPDTQSDIEIAALALMGLYKMGAANVTLDLSYPVLLKLILKSYGIAGGSQEAEWLDMLARKDLAMLQARPESLGKDLAALLATQGKVENTIEVLRGLRLCDDGKNALRDLEIISGGMMQAAAQLGLEGYKVTIDILETQGFQYHSGVCFALYCPAAASEIGRGGRYDLTGGQSACGFTAYMDSLLPILPEKEAKPVISVPANTAWDMVLDLQNKGWIVVRKIAGDIPEHSTHILQDGQITAL